MTESAFRPPRLAGALFRLFARGADRGTLPDDLDEYYPDIVRDRGRLRAGLWYWRQVLGSIQKLAIGAVYWGGIMLKSYLKTTLRSIARHKLHSAVNILGLAVGLTCAILILMLVRYELSFDRYHANARDIYRVVMKQQGEGHAGGSHLVNMTPGPLKDALTKDIPEVLRAARVLRAGPMVKDRAELRSEGLFFLVDPEFLEIFSFPLAAGDPRTALDEPFSVLLTEDTARRYFGHDNPVGRSLNVNEKYDFKVTGVLKNPPENSHFHFDFLASFQSLQAMTQRNVDRWGNNSYQTYVQLRPGIAAGGLKDKLDGIVQAHYRKDSGVEFQMQPLTSIHLRNDTNHELETNGDMRYIVILSAVGLFILLIAGLNYMNLATARTSVRAAEIGVRKVAGAGRADIVRQFFGESLLFAVFAFVLSLALVRLALPAFAALNDRALGLGLLLKPGMLGAIGAAVLVVGLVSGSYPALFLSSLHPVRILKGSGRTGRARSLGLRRSLVVIQFSISIGLIVCMLVVGRQLRFIRNKDLGFAKDQIVAVSLRDNNLRTDPEPFREALGRDPRIGGVAFSTDLPVTIRSNTSAQWEGQKAGQDLPVYLATVDDAFLDFYGIRPVLGRGFSPKFTSDPYGAIVLNRTAAKALGWADPVGKRLELGGPRPGTVIGVVEDFHFLPLQYEILPLAFQVFRAPKMRANYASIRISTGDAAGAMAAIEKAFKTFSPAYPFTAAFLDDRIEAMYRAERTLGKTFNIFAAIALFVACLGLFGLASFTAEQRTREIGIRKVLGSSVAGVVVLLNRDYLAWVAAANIVAWPAAYMGMQGWLKKFAYRAPVSAWSFVLAAVLAIGIALLTVTMQTLKTARANPVDSLKYE